MSLLFEVENLAQASPATVSRCGIVYNDNTDLGWKPYVQSWLDKREKVQHQHTEIMHFTANTDYVFFTLQVEAQYLKILFENYIETTLKFKKNNCKELIPITELNGVISLCRLYDSFATLQNGVWHPKIYLMHI